MRCLLQITSLLFLFFFLSHCNRKHADSGSSSLKNKESFGLPLSLGSPDIIKPAVPAEAVNLEDVFSVSDIIPLDSLAIIGTLDKLLWIEDVGIICLDRKQSQSIYCFNFDGSLKWEALNHGDGPEEFKSPKDVVYNIFSKQIELFDDKGQKVLMYSREGRLKQISKADIFASEFEVLGQNKRIFFTGNVIVDPLLDYKLLVLESDTSLLSKNFKIQLFERDIRAAGIRSLNAAFDHSILFNHYFTDTVYQITENKLKAKYKIDFDGKWFADEIDRTHLYDFDEFTNFENRLSGKVTGLSPVFETNDFFTFVYAYNAEFHTNIYNKYNKTLLSYSSLKIDNGILAIDGLPFFVTEGNEFVFVIDGWLPKYAYDEMVKHNDKGKLDREIHVKYPLFERLLFMSRLTDNYILIKAKLRAESFE